MVYSNLPKYCTSLIPLTFRMAKGRLEGALTLKEYCLVPRELEDIWQCKLQTVTFCLGSFICWIKRHGRKTFFEQ